MARQKGTFSGRNYVDFVGYEELLKKIEQLAGTVKEPLEEAVKAGAKLPEKEMLEFISKHYRSGTTEGSFEEGRIVWESDTILKFTFGFNVKKGGLPALFLDIGTPKIRPSFFVYYAVNKNMYQIDQLQRQALEKAVKKYMGGYQK